MVGSCFCHFNGQRRYIGHGGMVIWNGIKKKMLKIQIQINKTKLTITNADSTKPTPNMMMANEISWYAYPTINPIIYCKQLVKNLVFMVSRSSY